MKQKKIINLGFMKIEHNPLKIKESKPKFIKIERHKDTHTHTLESNINLEVLPKSMYGLVEKKERVKLKLHKPKRFWKLIKEINVFMTNMIVINILLTSVLLFLLSYLILMVIEVNKIYSLVIPLIYLGVLLFLKLRGNKYLEVEKKFPQLNEKIRTAVDNIYTENPVVDELRAEVSKDMKQVDYASFFNQKRTSYKILFIILLCFSIIFLANYDVGFKLNFERVFGFVDGGEGNATGLVSDIISATTSGPDDDIYGEEFLANLGRDELTININKVGYEINMDDVKDPTLEDFEDSLFPQDIGIEQAEVYNKNILKEHQELVKNYFKNMAES
jgi:hypothetical protein